MSGESCTMCGRTAVAATDGDPPLTWCADVVESGGTTTTRWICPECTRRYVRSIEAKLDHEWW